jgi:hypothetical protein
VSDEGVKLEEKALAADEMRTGTDASGGAGGGGDERMAERVATMQASVDEVPKRLAALQASVDERLLMLDSKVDRLSSMMEQLLPSRAPPTPPARTHAPPAVSSTATVLGGSEGDAGPRAQPGSASPGAVPRRSVTRYGIRSRRSKRLGDEDDSRSVSSAPIEYVESALHESSSASDFL